MQRRILVVEDDVALRCWLGSVLPDRGVDVLACGTQSARMGRLRGMGFDAALFGVADATPGSWIDLCRFRKSRPHAPVFAAAKSFTPAMRSLAAALDVIPVECGPELLEGVAAIADAVCSMPESQGPFRIAG